MKVEKISETQISFILSEADLGSRGLNLADVSYGSPKTNELFAEVIDIAVSEYNFRIIKGVPPLIEAIPSESDSLKILITTLETLKDFENYFGYHHFLGEYRPVPREKDLMENALDTFFNQFFQNVLSSEKQTPVPKKPNQKNPKSKEILMVECDNIDNIIDLCASIKEMYPGPSMLYSYENKYYLYLKSAKYKISTELIYTAREFGSIKHNPELVLTFLNEYGRAIIKKRAIQAFFAK